MVANLVTLGVDLLYLVDHLNENIPLTQLQQLAGTRTELRVIRKQTPGYSQSGVHSLLMRMSQHAGAHAYLHVDADELPDDVAGGPSFRDAVYTWLVESDAKALLIPRENYLQRRDVDRWGVDTLDAPARRVLGPLDADERDAASFFGRTPHVRALARLSPEGRANRWVRWGSHRVFGRGAERPGGEVLMEASPHLVIRHVPYPSRAALESRLAFRTDPGRGVIDNRGNAAVTWESVSVPVVADDSHPGPAVRTVHDDAFARIRSRIDAAGLTQILADTTLAEQRTALQPTEADEVFAVAADLLSATIMPRSDGVDDEPALEPEPEPEG